MHTITFHPSKPFFWVNLNGKNSKKIYKQIMHIATYQDPNAKRSTKYTSGKWDGKHRLARPTSAGYLFPNGLYSYVATIIRKNGDLEIQNSPTTPKKQHAWQWSGPTLRPHQVEGFQKTTEFLRTEPGVCIAMPTGSGKTTMACKLIQHYGLNTVVGVYTKELKEQWENAIKTTLGIQPNVFVGQHREIGEVTVAMLKTLGNAMKNHTINMDNIDLLIIDEAHGVPAKTVYDISMAMNPRFKIGLTATPNGRSDGADKKIYAATGAVLEISNIPDLVKAGSLADPSFIFVRAPYYGYQHFQWPEIYRSEIVENGPRNQQIKDMAERVKNYGLTVYINVSRKEHGECLAQMIKGSKFVHGTSKDRKETIENFKNRKLECLITTDILKEGVDIPEMDCIIMAGGMKGSIPTTQKIGRVLRPNGHAIIVDFIDSGKITSKHSLARIDTYRHLFGNEKIEAGIKRMKKIDDRSK